MSVIWINSGRFAVTTSDPYWANVVMLLQPAAADSLVVDKSSFNRTINRIGTLVAPTTTFTPFGTGASIDFPGNSSNSLWTPASTSLDMGTGDFSLEVILRLKAMPTGESYPNAKFIFGTGPASSTSGSQLYIGNTNLRFDIISDSGGPIASPSGMSINTWYYAAVTRSSNQFRAFAGPIGGSVSQINTTATRTDSWIGGSAWGIGSAEAESSLDANINAYIASLRITKGVARTITIPSTLFPTS
jgi:hypothetical protein